MFRNSSAFLLLSFSLVLSCCAQPPGQSGYDAIRNVSESNESERLQRFSEYSVNEQIDIYLYSESLVDTVTPNMRYYLSVNGRDKIPAILQRIDSDRDDDPREKVSLISALDVIDRDCQCLGGRELDVLTRNEMPIKKTDTEGFRKFKALYSEILNDIRIRKRK